MPLNLTLLERSMVRGTIWTLFNVGIGQISRLVKSLILSRLLFPEIYGTMALVWSTLIILGLLSDVGIVQAVVKSKRGDEREFLNTAWTMKLVRGLVLFLTTVCLAIPVASFFDQSQLKLLLPAAGFVFFIEAFASTKVYQAQRALEYTLVSYLSVAKELLGLLATIVLAFFYPTAWSLIGGALLTSMFYVFGSHYFLKGVNNEIYWNKDALKELLNFGKWVFLSSAIFVLYSQGDRLLLAKYLSPTLLGHYAVAVLLSEALGGVITKLVDTVFFPTASRVAISQSGTLGKFLYKTRFVTDALFVFPAILLASLGSLLVQILYEPRYYGAGWMLQILAVRLTIFSLHYVGAAVLFALGLPIYSMIQNICRVTWLFLGVPVAWKHFGPIGVVWVVALTEIPVLFLVWIGLYKNNLLSIIHELRGFFIVLLGLLTGQSILKLIPIASG